MPAHSHPQLHTRYRPHYCRHCVKTSVSIALLSAVMVLSSKSWGAVNPFQNGWVLDASSSILTFQTITNGTELETNHFTNIQGSIDEKGSAIIRIQLDSVETNRDLRNVRLRFLLFETHQFAQAIVSADINPATLATLSEQARLLVPLTFELDLHGIKQSLQMQTIVTRLAGRQVSVVSAAPLSIKTAMFGLDEGVKKLEASANVSIVPMGAVSFSLIFNVLELNLPDSIFPNTSEPAPTGPDSIALNTANSESTSDTVSSASSAAESDATSAEVIRPNPSVILNPNKNRVLSAAANASVPEQVAPDLSEKECAERFKTLSQTGEIDFKIASARLDPRSVATLTRIINVINRCPQFKLEIAGHTDSVGGEEANQILSELRAISVVEYLVSNNVDAQRLISKGYGETKPLVPNNSGSNRKRNRRIEFTIVR